MLVLIPTQEFILSSFNTHSGDHLSAVQTRSKSIKSYEAHAFVKISEALGRWKVGLMPMQEELLQFEIQKVWILIDLPYGKKAIGTKCGVIGIRKDEMREWLSRTKLD
ncbi:hypothetical protein Tco_0267917 [Tanacetum coccineum]